MYIQCSVAQVKKKYRCWCWGHRDKQIPCHSGQSSQIDGSQVQGEVLSQNIMWMETEEDVEHRSGLHVCRCVPTYTHMYYRHKESTRGENCSPIFLCENTVAHAERGKCSEINVCIYVDKDDSRDAKFYRIVSSLVKMRGFPFHGKLYF